MPLLATMDCHLNRFVDASAEGSLFIHTTSGDLDFRPDPRERIGARLPVAFGDEIFDILSYAPIEPRDGFRVNSLAF